MLTSSAPSGREEFSVNEAMYFCTFGMILRPIFFFTSLGSSMTGRGCLKCVNLDFAITSDNFSSIQSAIKDLSLLLITFSRVNSLPESAAESARNGLTGSLRNLVSTFSMGLSSGLSSGVPALASLAAACNWDKIGARSGQLAHSVRGVHHRQPRDDFQLFGLPQLRGGVQAKKFGGGAQRKSVHSWRRDGAI